MYANKKGMQDECFIFSYTEHTADKKHKIATWGAPLQV